MIAKKHQSGQSAGFLSKCLINESQSTWTDYRSRFWARLKKLMAAIVPLQEQWSPSWIYRYAIHKNHLPINYILTDRNAKTRESPTYLGPETDKGTTPHQSPTYVNRGCLSGGGRISLWLVYKQAGILVDLCSHGMKTREDWSLDVCGY